MLLDIDFDSILNFRYAVIIMEYVGSRNLHRLLIESEDKYLDPRLLLSAGKHVSSALAYCHSRGIIHLDVKPANVLVNSQAVFKLGDFGCSVSTSNPDLEVDHSLVGTPGYQVRTNSFEQSKVSRLIHTYFNFFLGTRVFARLNSKSFM